jgi:hypothetical protein
MAHSIPYFVPTQFQEWIFLDITRPKKYRFMFRHQPFFFLLRDISHIPGIKKIYKDKNLILKKGFTLNFNV